MTTDRKIFLESDSQENAEHVVVPAKAGIQCLHEPLKTLGSGFRRNDEI
jgi:hypothetical protein